MQLIGTHYEDTMRKPDKVKAALENEIEKNFEWNVYDVPDSSSAQHVRDILEAQMVAKHSMLGFYGVWPRGNMF